jgi:hypothetical protein
MAPFGRPFLPEPCAFSFRTAPKGSAWISSATYRSSGSDELEALFVGHPNLIGSCTVGDRASPASRHQRDRTAAFGTSDRSRRHCQPVFSFLDDGVTVYTSFALTLAILSCGRKGSCPSAPDNPELILLGSTVHTAPGGKRRRVPPDRRPGVHSPGLREHGRWVQDLPLLGSALRRGPF